MTDFLELGFDLLAIIADGGDVFVRAFGFLLLLDRRDNPPRRASGSDNILVGNGEEVSLINGKLATQLDCVSSTISMFLQVKTHIGNLLHEVDHLIIALSLLTEPGEESFTARMSVGRGLTDLAGFVTFRARSRIQVSILSYQERNG